MLAGNRASSPRALIPPVDVHFDLGSMLLARFNTNYAVYLVCGGDVFVNFGFMLPYLCK